VCSRKATSSLRVVDCDTERRATNGAVPSSSELPCVAGMPEASGWLHEHEVAEDRRDCYWLYVATNCNDSPDLATLRDPAAQPWQPVKKVQYYTIDSSVLPKETL